jgi:transcriptional antiterminator Rof (Rho-off)
MSGYRIIDCDLHDLYEIAVLRHRRLLLNWLDDSGLAHLELVQPTDLETTPAGEFLLARTMDGGLTRIRLDRILHARDPAAGEDFAVRPAGSGT